jgi:hypothetical protein
LNAPMFWRGDNIFVVGAAHGVISLVRRAF